jgi:peptidoglycan L-alanyl-D-glutamate endopeptidase CwlK
MINHDDLMAQLKSARPGDQTEHNQLVARLTAGGVIMAGGPRADRVQPDWRVDSVMRSDLPVMATDTAMEARPATVQRDSGFKFGTSSERELVGVDPVLVEVTRVALKCSFQDFIVYDGIRTVKEQQRHVKNGTSKTMQSKHLEGLAVDLVPWINGKPVWDWDGCYKIAWAMDLAATELGVAHRITWGATWDRKLSDFGGDPSAYLAEIQAYRARHAGPDFLDGPHFEITRS